MEVTMVGGPDDGKSFVVPDNFKTITIALPPNSTWINLIEYKEPTELITTKHITLDIKLTRNGYRMYWPY